MPGSLRSAIFFLHVEMHHLALAGLAAGAHQLRIILGEKEVVERLGEESTLRIEEAGNEAAFLVLEVVDHADRGCRRPSGCS
jgi:hypothetical protein